MKYIILVLASLLSLSGCGTLTEDERQERREVRELEEEIYDEWVRRCVLSGGLVEAVAATLNEKVRCVRRR